MFLFHQPKNQDLNAPVSNYESYLLAADGTFMASEDLNRGKSKLGNKPAVSVTCEIAECAGGFVCHGTSSEMEQHSIQICGRPLGSLANT